MVDIRCEELIKIDVVPDAGYIGVVTFLGGVKVGCQAFIGVAGFHKAEFDAGHAIKVIQSASKTFEHSLTFPARALQVLADKGVKTCASLAILVRNSQPLALPPT